MTPVQVIHHYDTTVRVNGTLDAVAYDDTGESLDEVMDVANQLLQDEGIVPVWPGSAAPKEDRDGWRELVDSWWEHPDNAYLRDVLSYLHAALQQSYRTELLAQVQRDSRAALRRARRDRLVTVMQGVTSPPGPHSTHLEALADAVLTHLESAEN